MIDGGHMIVPSMGQAIPCSSKTAVSCAIERLGRIHIVPITWQKVKNTTNARYSVSTRRIMGLNNSNNYHSTVVVSFYHALRERQVGSPPLIKGIGDARKIYKLIHDQCHVIPYAYANQ